MRSLRGALVHYPVLDRARRVVTTAITNLDLHDLGRSAFTYGIERLYIVHPIAVQRELAERVRAHWVEGSGQRRIPDRRPAMETLHVVASLDEMLQELGGRARVELWATAAAPRHPSLLSHVEARARLAAAGPPVVLVFGTGWGLAEEAVNLCDAQLEPIQSPRPDGYNHLSVRAAAAITFDRLRGCP